YGKMCRERGWMNQAAIHLQRASSLDSSNEQYRQESEQVNKMKSNSFKVPKAVIIGGTVFCALRICGYTYPILNACDNL
ncbi:MAG: hypothetical protein K2I33_01605, partial [Oscillospiraceae bacterium]|nr:hypothetical protein [Oscillospiraceae bacterium]